MAPTPGSPGGVKTMTIGALFFFLSLSLFFFSRLGLHFLSAGVKKRRKGSLVNYPESGQETTQSEGCHCH